ncbi:hypothetical protein HZS_5980 [Henneguya salminicola]|nr:hypothetical protein HZS_5980 [Henneguya salminicola]
MLPFVLCLPRSYINDKETDFYGQATYALQTSKCEEMYYAILRDLVVLTKYSWLRNQSLSILK